ncbi:amino acid ABC transporter permease [Azospirillum rugosum]|uniref:General L-amino acid transport system permease protein n=1 Tax=Azospirillum rugosum TaxID=416170 RepID=A0ABS4SFE6_9PROT|nr:amino acid ABC transporter permease [Azospirillum rugosum]MBP2291301.1 general L-amino acid transport system permease protein [Azospirillum rugosum]MDQ0525089.1 general L-amino acid transport system permease protein [Azospirillum rugosum]
MSTTFETPVLAPPKASRSPWRWARENLFFSAWGTLATLSLALLLAWALPPLVKWALLDAVWSGATREACLTPEGTVGGGACWVFVKVRFGQLMYGFYPLEQRWRVDAAALILALGLATVLPLRAATQRAAALAGVVIGGLGAGWLGGPVLGVVVALFLAGPLLLARDLSPLRRLPAAARVLLAVGLSALAAGVGGVAFGTPKAFGWVALVLAAGLFGWRFDSLRAAGLYLLGLVFPVLAQALLSGGAYGLPFVPTEQWGGLFLTLTIALTGMAASLPLGILLALGRRSALPVLRLTCIGFIEFIRGVPMITVLFLASVMLPLFLPEGVGVDKLLRALIGVALFSAAYMAEVVRGGLQALDPGQREAAESLGLGRVQTMGLVILPQALRVVIPGIVNTFIGLLKDTSLVAVIGLLDLIGIIKTATSDPNWLGFAAEGYTFVGLVFWVLCFSMARYSLRLERTLRNGVA